MLQVRDGRGFSSQSVPGRNPLKRRMVQVSQILFGAGDWIRFVAGIVKGLLGQGGDVGFIDAVGSQAERDANFGQKPGDEFDGQAIGVLVGQPDDGPARFVGGPSARTNTGIGRRRANVQAAGDPHPSVQTGFARAVEFHDVGQAERVGQSMVKFADGRKGMS